jgi:hypothetical protein
LLNPVKKQLELITKHHLPVTFLMQYDALINPDFVDLLSAYSKEIEIGGWLEIVQPMCEAANITWRGRPGYSWDWHAHVGFTVGYLKSERIALADVFMEKFKEVWGHYPASVGSWIIDAYTLSYLSERYGISASCNCKDQWGTDGYTLWGGYYGQAYYPSKNNVLCPAQTKEQQIPVPIFRMLGSDPIYQYDFGLDIEEGSTECQKVVTLEPVYTGQDGGGGNPSWVDWFFRENFNGLCLSFGYAQIGQENSFGWDSMKDGLTYQIEKLAKLAEDGVIKVQTLAESAGWFQKEYSCTPASAITALSDWKGEGRKSIWYNCSNYRVNFMYRNDSLWIRDIYKFDEQYEERYMDQICDRPLLIYDNLPVMDGNRWSGHGTLAGIYPVGPDGCELTFLNMDVSEYGDSLHICGELLHGEKISCYCRPDMLEWQFPAEGYKLYMKADPASAMADVSFYGEMINYNYMGFHYTITAVGADIMIDQAGGKANYSLKIRGKKLQLRFV